MSLELLTSPDQYAPTDWQNEDLANYITDYYKRPFSANWSEMGCYKTTTGLWLIERMLGLLELEKDNVLIVTTKSGKGAYWDAIPKSLGSDWRVFNVGTKTAHEVHLIGGAHFTFPLDMDEFVYKLREPQHKQIIVAHYNCFAHKSDMMKILTRIDWAFALLDEAHRIKNKDTQWTRNLKSLSAQYKHIMTGTGFINNPAEIWSLLNFCSRNIFSSYWNFRKYFCEEEDWTGYSVVTGIKAERKEEFRELRKKLGPRRTMKEVHPDIDEPIFTPITIELNATQRKMYDQIRTELRTLDQNNVPFHAPNVLAMLNRLRQICVATPELVREYFDPTKDRHVQEIRLVEPSTKLDAFMEFLEGLEWDEDQRQQVVVFSCFKDPLELLKTRLENAKVPYLHMQEKHGEKLRYEMWHDIWPQREHQVFMSTLQLGSESINLTANPMGEVDLASASHCVFLDRSWSPKDNNQGVARIYRPGQTGVAQIIHINAISTTDQRIEATNVAKTGWFNEIFGDDQ